MPAMVEVAERSWESDVSWKVWVGGALVLLGAGCLCLAWPALIGLVLILLVLGAVAVVAYRFL